MKLMITETQYKLLTEAVEGLDEFKKITLENYPEIIEYWDVIEKFIRDSECKKIEIEPIKIGIAVSMINGVIFNKNIFSLPITEFLFTIFHEIAHQYQYKKYGIEKMTSFYSDNLNIPKGYYKLAPLKQFEKLIENIKWALPNLKSANPEQRNEILYNWIKFKTQ